MLSIDAATTSAERFAFISVSDLIGGDREAWMECLKAFLAATQLLETDPAGSLAILNALADAPLLRYLAWCGSADPSPLFQFFNDQAFLIESKEAMQLQQQEFFLAVAQDLRQGAIGAQIVRHFWQQQGSMVMQTFLRLATLAARACDRLGDEAGREQWCHQALMVAAIFEVPVPEDVLGIAEPGEWHIGDVPAAVRFVKRWQQVSSPAVTVH